MTSWPYEKRPATWRRRMQNEAALKAEWDVPRGRLGGLVVQHRRRARIAATRAIWLFVVLCIAIGAGIAYYLGIILASESFADWRSPTASQVESYMAACTGGQTSAAAVSACIGAFADIQQASARTAWQVLAERAPPAILLLFLLATLGGLYRYNMRMAGFHHGRADAMTLLADGRRKEQVDQLVALAEVLAADKVEFGRANTPSDQAIELAKAVVSRRG